ncbi:nucleotide disphospho-sugar-binding domain-containing protein [Sciscionella sediminilitoris]|uniref:nucleotide disphospho-sugar-binding domain-containing protein n=1 Tax=Sciscionella sediminilitoris TaxID=1445613 RepID=UPI0004DF9C94|nr:nucleotide disphospho-sugar-binding domain-containing protein [Sciscionella sp. SE31]
MSRYLFIPYPMHGHVNPMAPLIGELVRRGDEVVVAVAAPFAGVFRDLGCEVSEIHTTVIPNFPENPTKEQIRRNRAMGLKMMRERRGIVRELRRRWPRLRPDMVVADIAARWGAPAAHQEGTPLASFTVTYAVSEQMVLASLRRRHSERWIRTVKRLGLLPQFHPSLRDHADLALVNATPDMQPEFETFGQRYHFVGPLIQDTSTYGDIDLPWERIGRGPLLFVSPGTVFGCSPQFFRSLAEEFAGTEWTVLMATAGTDPAEIGELPENVIARRFMPQSVMLDRASVFLTRASMNSALEAVLKEVPMIAVPRAYDQVGIAKRLVELGVAVAVGRPAEGRPFLDAARRLVADPETADRLAWMAKSLRHDDPAGAAADALRKHLQDHGV